MFQHWFNCFMIFCLFVSQYANIFFSYLVGRVSAHPVCRGLDGTVGSVDDYVAAGVVFDTETSPGVRLVCSGVDVKPAIKIINGNSRVYLLSYHASSRPVSLYNLHIELSWLLRSARFKTSKSGDKMIH